VSLIDFFKSLDSSDTLYDVENIEYYLIKIGYTLSDINNMNYDKAVRMVKRKQYEDMLMRPSYYFKMFGMKQKYKVTYPNSWNEKPKREYMNAEFDISDVIINE